MHWIELIYYYEEYPAAILLLLAGSIPEWPNNAWPRLRII